MGGRLYDYPVAANFIFSTGSQLISFAVHLERLLESVFYLSEGKTWASDQ